MVDQYHFPILMLILTIVLVMMIHHFRSWLDHHDLFWICLLIVVLIGLIFLQLRYPSNVIDDTRIIEDTALNIYEQINHGSFHFNYFDQ